MQKILGLLVVLGCVFGGYFEAGGQLVAIWQPAEMIIILGAGFGAMIIGNPKHVLKEIAHQIKGVISKKQLGPEFQRQLLMCLYELLEMVQNGGLRMLDQHIEQPEESTIFQKYPLVLTQKRLVTFIADNFRLMAMGKIDAHELEGILDQELDTAEESLLTPSRSLQRTAEAMPGFGICAAVLGIIITMQSIDGSIALIGLKVAAALVGTFLGVFICYCLMDPLANAMEQQARAEHSLLECVRTVLVAQAGGKPTLLAVDAGRKLLHLASKPTFANLDAWVNAMLEHGGAWKVAFADFTLAMMALFMTLWIVNSVSKSERESIIAALHGQSIFNGGGLSPLNKISPSHPPKPATVAVPEETEKKARDVNEKTVLLKKKSATELGELATSINTIARDAHMEANLEMEIVPQGLRVLIKDDQNRNMFERGSAQIMPFFKRLLVELAPVFDSLDNKIIITGHTDAMAYKNNIYNNWNLSGDRALSARRVLEEAGMPEDKVMQVSAMADQMLLDSKNPQSAGNRRIEIMGIKWCSRWCKSWISSRCFRSERVKC